MSSRCPAGHTSSAADYCDVCGAPIPAGGAAGATGAAGGPPAGGPGATAAVQACPHCADPNSQDALFCESCGYDFTTGQRPSVAAALTPPASVSSAAAKPVDWVAEVWVDPDWYAHEAVASTDPCPSAGTPRVVPLRATTELVGRTSKSRNIHPTVDCGSDSAVSRRHAELTIEGGHWYVEDLGSVNGTYVGKAGAPLPADPIAPNRRRALAEDERVYVGAWTRLMIRSATTEERGA
ncbi:MAG TPA: FHA domain-containing protein [Mycobacteriales bacterium]|nr:FHA domain-containing protein [Mycobacteriales bacterium]